MARCIINIKISAKLEVLSYYILRPDNDNSRRGIINNNIGLKRASLLLDLVECN